MNEGLIEGLCSAIYMYHVFWNTNKKAVGQKHMGNRKLRTRMTGHVIRLRRART